MAALAILLAVLSAACISETSKPALLLRGAVVVDGTGAAPRIADVAIDAGRITYIGTTNPPNAVEELNLDGLILTPGLIDLRPGVPFECAVQMSCAATLAQAGITTLITGMPAGVEVVDVDAGLRRIAAEGLLLNAGIVVDVGAIALLPEPMDWQVLLSSGVLSLFGPLSDPAIARERIAQLTTEAAAAGLLFAPALSNPITRRFGVADAAGLVDDPAAFWEVLGVHVRRLQIASLPEAIQLMTAAPASEVGIADRGRIVPGAAADLIAFDLEAVPRDYSSEGSPPPWLRLVLINGIPVVKEGRAVSATPGQLIAGG